MFEAHAGLALATSIGSSIATFLMFYGLKKKIGSLGTVSYIKCGIKSGVASLVMGAVAYFTYHRMYAVLGEGTINNLISLVSAVGFGIIVYGLLCYLFGIEEVRDIFGKVKGRLRI